MTYPLISVIVPIYNVEKYLDKCVQSIVNQTYQNLEIILVDDGSPDNCPQICDDWAEKDSRIKVIHKENGGLSSARNAGLNVFTGEYVIFVDSDDWIEPFMIETMAAAVDEEKADMVVCGFVLENLDGSSVAQEIKQSIYEKQEIVRNFLLDEIRPEACSKLYKAELLKPFRFDENRKYAEDITFNFDVMLHANRLFSTGIPCYHYLVRNEDSITSAYMTNARAASWDMFIDIMERCGGNKELEEAAVFRFTVYTFAVLSRIMKVKSFKKKYYDGISDALIKYKNEIFLNDFIPKKHKIALKILSFNKHIFKVCFSAFRKLPELFYALKSIIAYFAFGLQALLCIFKVMFEKIRNKDSFIFLMLTPCHENYGDHAIAFAEKQIFKDRYIFEITGDMLSRFVNYPLLFKIMVGKSTVLFQGGGYLGTFWFDYGEKILRKAMQIVPNNKIVVLPQSIYYENSSWGKEQLELSQKIYSHCSNLILTARDKISFDLMKKYYPNVKICLIPDVVLFLDECCPAQRNGAMIAFRNDLEKSITYSVQKEVETFAVNHFGEVKKIDMIAVRRFDPENRENELKIHFERFRKSEIVFTDRLHGMIFSAITGTPCIVLKNKNHKIKAVYDWLLKDFPYILFMDSFDEHKAENFMSKIRGKNFEYDNSYLQPYYEKLVSIINGVENFE